MSTSVDSGRPDAPGGRPATTADRTITLDQAAGGANSSAGTRPRRLFGAKPTIGAAPAAKAVVEDASTLIRAEIDLAKAEFTQGIKTKATGLAALAVAGVLAWLGIQALLITIGFALALVLPGWAAALIVTLLLLVPAGIAALIGKKKLSDEQAAAKTTLETTKRNLEEDLEWTKSHLPSR